jgi:hypothetical protein
MDGMGRGFIQCLISDFGCATFHSVSETIAVTTTGDASQHYKEGTERGGVEEEVDHHSHYRPDFRNQKGLTFEVGTR